MGSETIATLVVTAVIVAALAVFVLSIGLALRRLSLTLGTILIGLRAIRMQTAPLGAVLGDLTEDVDIIEDALEGAAGAIVTSLSPSGEADGPVRSGPAGYAAPAPPAASDVADEDEPDAATADDAPREPSRDLVRVQPPRQDGRGRTSPSRSRRGSAGGTTPRRRRPRPTPADMRARIAGAGEKMAADR